MPKTTTGCRATGTCWSGAPAGPFRPSTTFGFEAGAGAPAGGAGARVRPAPVREPRRPPRALSERVRKLRRGQESFPEFGVVMLHQHLATWVAHDFTHLSEIARVMAAQYRDAVGPWAKIFARGAAALRVAGRG